MNTLGTRLKQRRAELGISQLQLSKKLKISQSAVALLESGRNQSTTKIVELAAALETTPEWLLHGVGNAPILAEPFVLSDFASSADSPIGLKLDYVKKLKWNENDLDFFEQYDASMNPTIDLNDCVVFNKKQTDFDEGAVFLIKRNHKLILRRVFLNEESKWIYRCDNQDKAKYADAFQLDDDVVMGRVVWAGGYQRFV